MEFSTLTVDLTEEKIHFKTLKEKGIYGVLDYAIYLHSDVYRTYLKPPYSPDNVVVFGKGPFAGSILPGSHRLVFSFRSPLYGTIFPSTMGGAAYTFQRTGVDFVSIVGKAKLPSVIFIEGKSDSIRVFVEPIDNDLITIWKGFNGKKGVYALTEYLIEKYSDVIEGDMRIACVGPASANTNYGAIFSQSLRDKKILEGSEDWAARGGGGSVLLKAHNVAAVVFGGVYKEEKKIISNYGFTKKLFSGIYKKPLFEVIKEKTEKYRFKPEHNSGGTFGEDYIGEKEYVPVLNWQMPFISGDDRKKLFEKIKDDYLAVFNEEAIETKSWTTCGEPCPASCKKVRRGFKTDYEPYNANGPLSGNFFLHAADLAVKTVDSLGFDAIEFGCMASWLFEIVSRGLLTPEEAGLDDKPVFEVSKFLKENEEVSRHNEKILSSLAEKVAFGQDEVAKILGLGKRKAAAYFDKKYRERLKSASSFKDFGVFVALGKDGEICPTMYWAVGNFIPLPVQGKYWTYYKFGVFPEPEVLAEKIIESSLSEFWYDNVGWCRFHRRWMTAGNLSCEIGDRKECKLSRSQVKPVLERLFEVVYGERIDIEKHAKEQMGKLAEYAVKAGYGPVFPDSERVIDLIASASSEFGNEQWENAFKENKLSAARNYIDRVLSFYSKHISCNWKI